MGLSRHQAEHSLSDPSILLQGYQGRNPPITMLIAAVTIKPLRLFRFI